MSDHDELRERRIGGERIYDGKILTLDRDRVRLPDGSESVREVVRHPGAVVMLPVHQDGSVALVRQHRYPTGEVLLELPAGKLDVPGEPPEECARRELAEETGLAAGRLEPLGSFFTSPGFCDEILYAYLATDLCAAGEETTPDSDEHLAPETVRGADLRRLVADGTIRDAKTLATLLLAAVHGRLQL